MFGFFDESRFEKRIKDTVEYVLRQSFVQVDSALAKLKDAAGLTVEVAKLKAEIEDLTIQKGRKEEEFARKEREIEHKVGLERKRQEFEIEAAKREAIVTVREEALKADKERFEAQMAFQQERFEEEVGYLKGMVGQVLERLPSIEVAGSVAVKKRG